MRLLNRQLHREVPSGATPALSLGVLRDRRCEKSKVAQCLVRARNGDSLLRTAVSTRIYRTIPPVLGISVDSEFREHSVNIDVGDLLAAAPAAVTDARPLRSQTVLRKRAPRELFQQPAAKDDLPAALLIDWVVAISDGRLDNDAAVGVFTRWAPRTRQLRNIVKKTALIHLAKR